MRIADQLARQKQPVFEFDAKPLAPDVISVHATVMERPEDYAANAKKLFAPAPTRDLDHLAALDARNLLQVGGRIATVATFGVTGEGVSGKHFATSEPIAPKPFVDRLERAASALFGSAA